MSSPISQAQQNLHGIMLRCAGVVCFAVMSAAMKRASEDGAGAIEMLFVRAVIGAPTVLAWVALGPGIATLHTRRPRAHLFRSLLGIASLAMVYQALILLPIADAVTIGFSSPAFATMLSAMLIGETVGRHRWMAVLVGFAGILVVTRPGGEALSHAGIAFAVLGALMAGAVTVTIRQLGSSETSAAIVFWFFMCMLAISSIAMIFVAQPHRPLTWGLLLFGGLAGVLAQIFMTSSLRAAPVAVIAPFDYGQIVWAALLGWMIWSAVPSGNTLIGAALIATSGLYTAWREHRLHRVAVAAQPME